MDGGTGRPSPYVCTHEHGQVTSSPFTPPPVVAAVVAANVFSLYLSISLSLLSPPLPFPLPLPPSSLRPYPPTIRSGCTISYAHTVAP